MVEVLKAVTLNHAPLSQAQTVKVFQYLEDLNKDTMRQIQDLKRTMDMSTSGTGDFKMDMRSFGAQIATAQQELVKTNTRLSAFRVDIMGNAANVVVLQEQAAKTTDNLNQLKEGQKVTNTNVHNLREEQLIAKDEIRKLQKEVASLKEAKENVLQAKLDHAMLAMQQCLQDVQVNKMRTLNNEDSIRDLKEALSTTQAQTAKINNAKDNHDKRMAELNVQSEKLKENLELTNGVVMRIHTEHEETRAKALDNSKNNHEVDVALRRLKDQVTQLNDGVNIVNDELSRLAAGVDTQRDKLTETLIRLGGTSSGNDSLQNAVYEIGKKLEIVHSMAANTEDNLKKTNAMVLPNLGAEGAFNAGATGYSDASDWRSGKAMNSSRGSDPLASMRESRRASPRNKGSPRRRKEAAWFSRNIGSVPDRMAWI